MLCGEILSMEHQRMHSAWPLSISGARHKIGSAMTHAETKLSWIRSGQLTKLAWQHKTIQAMKSLKHQWLYYAHKKSGATATRPLCFVSGLVVSSICSGPRWYSHGWNKFHRKEDNQAALVQHGWLFRSLCNYYVDDSFDVFLAYAGLTQGLMGAHGGP